MSKVALIAALCWLSLGTAMGQINLEIVLDQDLFLRDESLPVKVRIGNRSGQTLQLGAEPDWITFSVHRRDGFPVPRTGKPDLGGEFTLESAMAATKTVDLMHSFDLSQPGRYTVSATLNIKQWQKVETSTAKSFEVIRGSTIWSQEIGVPTTESGAPEVRRYTLQQARTPKNLVLYVRVTDGEERTVYRVFPVGRLLSFSRPEAQVDRLSQLHLLYQFGPRSFQYLVVSPYGTILMREMHDYAANRPVLRSNDEGRIFVHGGNRRRTPDDLPPPLGPADLTNDVAAPKS